MFRTAYILLCITKIFRYIVVGNFFLLSPSCYCHCCEWIHNIVIHFTMQAKVFWLLNFFFLFQETVADHWWERRLLISPNGISKVLCPLELSVVLKVGLEYTRKCHLSYHGYIKMWRIETMSFNLFDIFTSII